MSGDLEVIGADYRFLLGIAPRGKGSARGQPGQRSRTDIVTREYMRRAAAAFREQWGGRPAISGPASLLIEVWLPRPRKLTLEGTRRGETPPPLQCVPAPVAPDADNIDKGLFDALVKAGVLADDRLLVSTSTRKWFVELDGEPGIEVLLSRVEDPWAAFAAGGSRP